MPSSRVVWDLTPVVSYRLDRDARRTLEGRIQRYVKGVFFALLIAHEVIISLYYYNPSFV